MLLKGDEIVYTIYIIIQNGLKNYSL